MPKQADNLLSTDLELKAARSAIDRTEFRIKGAPGLQLRVTRLGTKTWALAYKSPATGRWAKVALGRYPSVSMAEAKRLAHDRCTEIRNGRDPVHDRREAELAETFAELAQRYMREHEQRNARLGQRSCSTLEALRQLDRDILPKLGRMRADAVSRQHVMQVVETIADRGSYVAADRALGLIRAIYNWACGTGRLDRNPSLGLKKRNAVRPKTRVLSNLEIRTLWHALDSEQGSITPSIRLALKLQLHTASRISEAMGAARSEFNLEEAVWTIPAVRTKANREHVLPLSPAACSIVREALTVADALEVLKAARAERPAHPLHWVFPGPRAGQAIDPHAATRALVRDRALFREAGIIEPFNTHDLRRTVATQLAEMGTPDEIIERVLNHAPRTVAGKHYNHARYIGAMRRALEAWAEHLSDVVGGQTPTNNIVSLPKVEHVR